MYVKIYSHILDSSLADNRRLRHFFMDLLLLSDPDGNIIMTPGAIQSRIRSTLDEVQWGLEELQKPDKHSRNLESDGRRIVPLEGHGYGWRIVNYKAYRDYKSAKELREASAERVRRWREKHLKRGKELPGERAFLKRQKKGEDVSMEPGNKIPHAACVERAENEKRLGQEQAAEQGVEAANGGAAAGVTQAVASGEPACLA